MLHVLLNCCSSRREGLTNPQEPVLKAPAMLVFLSFVNCGVSVWIFKMPADAKKRAGWKMLSLCPLFRESLSTLSSEKRPMSICPVWQSVRVIRHSQQRYVVLPGFVWILFLVRQYLRSLLRSLRQSVSLRRILAGRAGFSGRLWRILAGER